MSDSLAGCALARTAGRLNRAGGPRRLPPLVLMTDDERLVDPIGAAWALPRGSLVIIRARRSEDRASLAAWLKPIARSRNLRLLAAADPALAVRARLDGLHLPEARACEASHWRALHPNWLITIAAHSLRAVALAKHADAALLAPVFATVSHRDRPPLAPVRANQIARHARVAVYALGGIDNRGALRLAGRNYAGIAAISALAV